MRPGNTHTANNIYNFFEETLQVIDRVRIGLIRADGGFYGGKFFRYMEERAMKYIVAAKVNAIMKRRIMDLTGWLSMEGGVHIAEFHYKAVSWKRSRRIIVLRQSDEKRPKAAQGKLLFKDLTGYTEYRYQFYVTNLDLEAKMVWDMYRQRADSENRIKELKHDFGMNGFCLHKFYATEAAFRMVMIAYNMISLFRQAILKQDTQQYLSTLRFKCFALGSWITKRGRKKVLKLSVAPKRRAWVDGLFSELVHLRAPFPLKSGS